MKGIFFFLIFCYPFFLYSQCKDSLITPDKYHLCPADYHPVCACDGKTYRNDCAAEFWGAISPGYYTSGPCDDFDIDLYPNIVSADPGSAPSLNIYMKYPGTATVQIYNSFGRLVYEKLFSTDQSNALIPTANPYSLREAQTFLRDIYLLIVSVNGNRKTVKFIKADNSK